MEAMKSYIEWMIPRVPQSVGELLVTGGTTIAAAAVAAYFYINAYHDYIWDDLKFAKAAIGFIRELKSITPANGIFTPITRLEEHSRTLADKYFLLFKDEKYTFSQTNETANQVADALGRLGITREQQMTVIMKNKPEILFFFYGCMKLAIPLGFLNTNLRTKSLLHCIKEAHAKNLLVDDDPDLLAAVDEIYTDLQAEGIRVLVYGSSDKYESFTKAMEGAKATNPDPSVRQGVTEKDTVAYIFTSGTTGLPKAAKVSYRRWTYIPIMCKLQGVNKDDVMYAPLPLYHSSSLFVFNAPALYFGLTYAFAPKFSATNFWKDCAKYNATVVQYIGETCRYLLAKPEELSDKQHRVRLAIGNGLRKDIWEKFKTRFNIPRIGEFYGATEGNIAFLNLVDKFGAVGRMSPLKFNKPNKVLFLEYNTDTDEVVRGEDGFCKVVPRGTPGLVVSEITENSTFDGYTNQDESNRKILQNVLVKGDAYFNTGDLLLWDHDYYVYFADRLGDTFRWRGENVSTIEVSNLLNELEVIVDCTVYGVPIPGMDGKCGMAAIVLTSGTLPTEEVLKAIYIQGEHYLPSYARPVFIRFMPELHLTGTYKHLKGKLRQEGFDHRRVPDVYVNDLKQATYVPLTSDVYDSITNGTMKV